MNQVRLAGMAVLLMLVMSSAVRPASLLAQGGPSPGEIGQALSAAMDAVQAQINSGDMDAARRAYDAFENRWEAVENTVRARSRGSYRDIEDAMRVLRDTLYRGTGDPASALTALRGQVGAFASGASAGGPSAAPAAPTTAAPAAPSARSADPALVLTSKTSALGEVLADRDGRTLYVFTDDEQAGPGRAPTLTCTEDCADDWPPLEFNSTRRPLVAGGLDQGRLGTVRRDGRTIQVTYAGRGLYYWGGDYVQSDIRGQGVGGNWFVMSPRGDVIRATEGIPQSSFSGVGSTTLTVAQTALGPVVADGSGQSLYMFKDDGSVDYARSTCVSVSCTGDWPPVPVTGRPTVGTGLDANLASTITRPDGTLQVTYAGYPLYKWAGDFNPGDIRGQLVGSEGGDWFLITPAGSRILEPDPAWLAAPLPDVVRTHRAS
jgi:predicted lipoprotein with Yx(FWY)xxD motif